MVFNANISVILWQSFLLVEWQSFLLVEEWQSFLLVEEPDYQQKTTDLSQVTENFIT
jgi:hypothetical protein